MSIRHLLAAAELEYLYTPTATTGGTKLSPSHKWALAAIADDASDLTDKSFPGLEKIMRWSGTGKRRALELVQDLTEAGLVESVSPGYPGQRAIYRVCIPTQRPVDNPEIMGAESRTQPEKKGAGSRARVRDIAPLSGNTLKTLNQSHRSTHVTGPVENGDDQEASGASGWATSRRRRRAEKHLNQQQLEQLVDDIYADLPVEHRPTLIRNAALWVIGKALSSGSRLTDPTAYVAASIRNEPEVHRKRAFEQVVRL